MKQGPLIAFLILGASMWLVPHFMSEGTWSRGGGDVVLIVLGVIVLGLVVWEGRIKSK
jgi:hypothetical protein